MQGIGITQGQQGGCGYPPLIVKYKGKWVWVDDSRNHGGSICYLCSKARDIPYGHTPGGRFEQPKPYGSRCYRSLLERRLPYKSVFSIRDSISWNEFVDAIRLESGEPEAIGY